MKKENISEALKQKLVLVMRDHALAKFGDSLINFVYSLARTKVMNEPIGERVYDKALAEAVKHIGLRTVMRSSLSAGEIGDGAEALIGYAYLNDIMTIDEMVERICGYLEDTKEELQNRKWERENMIYSIAIVLDEIKVRIESELDKK